VGGCPGLVFVEAGDVDGGHTADCAFYPVPVGVVDEAGADGSAADRGETVLAVEGEGVGDAADRAAGLVAVQMLSGHIAVPKGRGDRQSLTPQGPARVRVNSVFANTCLYLTSAR
jgi:hypothetical protein